MSEETTQEIYERARFGQSVTPGTSPAVLVVDFSRGFTDPE
ncbi:MAG: carbamoylsarcosine amidase, partial [Actinomycetota bacterium]|nr:carbamoylsarcosine amidase [Actinomycetota bacterium]